MFLKLRHQTQSAVAIATTIAALASGACNDSTAGTDLRPEGPPDVLAVLVLNDSTAGLVEAATYCKHGDKKRPNLVGLPDFTTTTLCPDDLNADPAMVSDASPDTFYVRIVFDELLKPEIEDLIPILDDNGLPSGSFTGTLANTQPVTLQCKGVDGAFHNVEYDGYYSPSGNAVTWPVGPSLVIKPIKNVIVPTNSDCQVAIKDGAIFDKQGNGVTAEDLARKYPFKISGIKPLVIDPSDSGDPAKPTTVDVTALYGDNYYIQANTTVRDASWCKGANDFGNGCDPTDIDFTMTPQPGFCATNGNPCIDTARHCDAADPTDTCDPAPLYAYSLAPFGLTPAEFGFGPFGYPETDATYTFEVKAGATLIDQCGAVTTFGAPDIKLNTKVTVKTNKMDFKTTNAFTINQGDVVPATRKMKVNFTAPLNQSAFLVPVVDPTKVTLEPATSTCTPPGTCTALTPATMIRSSTENDVFMRGHYKPDTMYTFTIKAGTEFADFYGAKVTQAADKVITFKTQATAITASAPANGATVTKATPASVTTISFTFSTAMDPASFDINDIEFTGTPTPLTFVQGATSTTACTSTTSTGCQLQVKGTFTPGTYQIKLKKDAVIKDIFGTDFVVPADRVIKFTIKEAAPAPVIPCLGA